MADNIQPCTCLPYETLCCCGPKNGICITQPKCQKIPDGRVVNNPAFSATLGKSFWTYKLFINCATTTKIISSFVIPICEIITKDHIKVCEKVDGCCDFKSIPFTLVKNDPDFGTAPAGFQFIKIEIDNRYGKGVCAVYRLEITGDYPLAHKPISVKAGTSIIVFDCPDCFIVPKCNPQGKLIITKKCRHEINNNQATLYYEINVSNSGNAALDHVQLNDIIFMPSHLTVGTITVTPPTLHVDTLAHGKIKIYGDLGTIPPGGQVYVSYIIPIANVTSPGKYIINNNATVSATGTKDTASCSSNLNVVRLKASKCCKIEENKGIYTLTVASMGSSPDILINLYDHMEVPAGITVKFIELNGCEGHFSGSTDPIPTNTDIPGPVGFDFVCKNALVPSGSSYQKFGSFLVVSSSVVGGTATISNTITNVEPVEPSAQILLDVENIPVTAHVDVELDLSCKDSCH